MFKNELEKCTSELQTIQSQLGVESVKQEKAKYNNTFFDACKKSMIPMLDLLLLSRELGSDYRLGDEAEGEIIKIATDFKTAFDSKSVVKPLALSSRSTKALNAVQNKWTELIDGLTSALVTELNVLKSFYGPGQTTTQINYVISTIATFKANPSIKGKQHYLDMIKRGSEFLKEQHFTPEVKAFLEKIVKKEATVADLTPAILDWIKEAKFADKISLNIFMQNFA